MTVKQETNTKRYVGLSSDSKPLPEPSGGGPVAGSTFLESDTGRLARFNGKEWFFADVDGSGKTNELLNAIYEELHRLRVVTELSTGIESDDSL